MPQHDETKNGETPPEQESTGFDSAEAHAHKFAEYDDLRTPMPDLSAADDVVDDDAVDDEDSEIVIFDAD